MATSGMDQISLIDRLKLELRHEPKKVAVLAALVVVAAVIVGRVVLGGDSNSAPARASAAASPSRAGAGLPCGGLTPPDAKGRGGASDYSPGDLKIRRDLFAPNPEFFPKAASIPAGNVKPTTPVDPHETDEGVIRARARSMSLKSTIVGKNPTAIINGTFVTVGEWINGFKVVEITAHGCVLERNGVRVSLEMSNADGAP